MQDSAEQDRARIQEKIDKLKMSKFKQQMLPAYRPVPTYTSTMTCFFVFGVLISAVGIVLLIMSN